MENNNDGIFASLIQSKHKALIFGNKMRVLYDVEGYSVPRIYNYHYSIDSKVEIFNGEIENPPLNVDEVIYIKDINKSLKITGKARNLEGGYVYSTNYAVEEVIDEESNKSKDEAEKKLKDRIKERQIDKENKLKEEIRNNKWYRKLFKKKS